MNSTPDQPLADPAIGPPPPSTAHWIFLGRFGLRAGWSIAIFTALFLVFAAILGIATLAASGQLKQLIAKRAAHAAATAPPRQTDIAPKSVVISETVSFTAVAFASLLLALIERRRAGVYGINRANLLDVLPGAFWGLASLSLLVAVLRAAHVLVFDAQALHGVSILLFGAKWLFAFFLVGMFEEYLTRGFLQYTLTRGLFGLGKILSPTHARLAAFWLAAIVMSIVFGAGHLNNSGETPVGIMMVFVAGIVFSYALWRTGSLWWAIGFHTAWDWAQSFLYGVPDSGNVSAGRLFLTHATGKPLLSGGADGPEGSVFVLPTMLLVALIIRFTTRQRPQPPLEQEPPRLHAQESSPAIA